MGYVSCSCAVDHAQQSHTMLGSLKLLLLFCARDQTQLDAASVSSIQVVGVVEALIQNAETLFPGGDVLSSVISKSSPTVFLDCSPASGAGCLTNSPCGLEEADFSFWALVSHL